MMNIAIDCLRKYQLSTTFAISMNEPRVLITGFSKFSDFKYNISEKVVDMIRGIKFNNFVTSTEILSVNQEGASLVANKIYSGEFFHTIIHLGFSSKSKKIRFEKFAYNEFRMTQKDNSGRQISSGKIIDDDVDHYTSNSPIESIEKEFNKESNVEWSIDPGRYVCNETYFKTLSAINLNQLSDVTNVLFVHLPSEDILDINEQSRIIIRLIKSILKPCIEVVGGVIYDKKGRILSCKRPQGKSWSSWWEFPGGKIESGESPTSALSRELKEELSLSISTSNIVAEEFFDYDEQFVKLYIFDCGIINDDEIELLEHDEMRWLSQKELLDVKWLPADLPIINRWYIEGIPNPHQD